MISSGTGRHSGSSRHRYYLKTSMRHWKKDTGVFWMEGQAKPGRRVLQCLKGQVTRSGLRGAEASPCLSGCSVAGETEGGGQEL